MHFLCHLPVNSSCDFQIERDDNPRPMNSILIDKRDDNLAEEFGLKNKRFEQLSVAQISFDKNNLSTTMIILL
jgi:hypothetical protein